MKRTMRLLVCKRSQAFGAFFFAVFFFGGWIGCLFGFNLWAALFLLGPIFVPMSFWMMSIGLAQIRLDGMEVVCSPEGIGVGHLGEDLWLLPWEQYGGYRPTKTTVLQACFHLERMGIEVYDRTGKVCGTLPLDHLYASSGSSRRWAIWEELDRRVPEDGIKPGPPEPSWLTKVADKRPWQTTAFGCLPSVVLLGLMVWVGRLARLDDTWANFFVSYQSLWLFVPLLIFPTIGFYGLCGLGRRSQAKRPVQEPPEPAEGPSLRDHRLELELDGRMVTLKEGFRYRYVHPEVAVHLYRNEASGAWFAGVLGLGILIVLTGLALTTAGLARWAAIFPIAAIFATLKYVSAYAASCRSIQASMRDTFVLHHGMLIVVRPSGEHLAFPILECKPVRAWSQGGVRVCVLRQGDTRYAYDPTHLYEVGPVEDLDSELPLPLVEQP